MVSFFRQFLVFLLVMLQYVAPLVHAHTGGVATESGLHLYEFEALHISGQPQEFSATQHSLSAESCIVNVGSAIKQRLSYPEFWILPEYPVTFQNPQVNRQPALALQPEHCVSKPLRNLHGCRAPPSVI